MIECKNTDKCLSIKEIYAEKTNQPLNKYRIRLLLKGQEIKDEHTLFMHNIDDGTKIQVSVASIQH